MYQRNCTAFITVSIHRMARSTPLVSGAATSAVIASRPEMICAVIDSWNEPCSQPRIAPLSGRALVYWLCGGVSGNIATRAKAPQHLRVGARLLRR